MRLIVLRVLIAAALLFLVSFVSSWSVVAKDPAQIRILFDFGDGTYVWANATVPDPEATNATWLAVQAATEARGISIASSWDPRYGIAISDIGDRHPPVGFVGLYEWNTSARSWDLTNVGISSLVVTDGAWIALYDAGFDSVTFATRAPIPTPESPYPVVAFRGDLANSGTSISPTPDNANLAWDHDLGAREIASTPAVAYGNVFVATRSGTFALEARTGERVWTNGGAKGFSSPAVYDQSVIVGTSNGTIVRLNASDGSVLWETRLLARTLFSGITSSPKIAFDHVFVGTFNESGGPGEVVSLWVSNGTVAWHHATGSVHYSSPAYSNGTVYVGIMGTYNTTSQVTFGPPFGVLALDATDGTEQWFYRTAASVAASVTVAGSRLIAPSKDGNVYAIDRATGALDWKVSVDAGISSPAVYGSTIFVGGGSFGASGRVVALDVATGSVKWSLTPNGPVQASIAYARGTVIFATNVANGTVYAVNASAGRVLWTYEPSPPEYILGSPVIADAAIFVPSDNGHVYALAHFPQPTGATPFSPILYLLFIGSPLGIALIVAVVLIIRRRSRHGP